MKAIKLVLLIALLAFLTMPVAQASGPPGSKDDHPWGGDKTRLQAVEADDGAWNDPSRAPQSVATSGPPGSKDDHGWGDINMVRSDDSGWGTDRVGPTKDEGGWEIPPYVRWLVVFRFAF